MGEKLKPSLASEIHPETKSMYTQINLKVQRVVTRLTVNDSLGLQCMPINTFWNAMLHTVYTLLLISV